MAQFHASAAANGAVATQSSILAAEPGAVAANVTDQNRNGIWNDNGYLTLNHTEHEAMPWVRIMFAGALPIDVVNIWNRVDNGLGDRLSPFSVRLFNGGTEVWSQTGLTFVDNIDDGDVRTAGMGFYPMNVVADMIEVQLDGTNFLNLAEVEAYSPVPEPGIMIAVGAGAAALLRRRRKQA